MLQYATHGSPEHPTLCFLHGFMGSSEEWSSIIEALEGDAHCLTVDLPGHGESLDRPSYFYSMEGSTQALVDVFDEADVDQCTLIGYSMGGRLALYLALFQPERIQRLVLESTSPGLSSEEERAHRRNIDETRAERIEENLTAFLEDWYRQPLFESLERHDLVEEMVATRRSNDPSELARALRGLSPGRQPSLWERLDGLKIPTLLLTGELDSKYVTITERVARLIESSRRVVVPRAGHNVHAERPKTFLSHVTQFLRET